MQPVARVKLIAVAALLSTLLADRLGKIYFLNSPDLLRESFTFTPWLSFHFVQNPGIAFGLLMPFWPLVLITGAAVLALWYGGLKAWQKNQVLLASGFFFTGLGAFSNLWDRIAFGAVVDYIDVSWFTVLNIADIMITVGILFIIFSERRKSNQTTID